MIHTPFAWFFCLSLGVGASLLDKAFLPNIQQALRLGAEDETICVEDDRKPAKIAIIGSGITGASAAFNLYESFRSRIMSLDDPLPEITVFERNPVVGGRITQAYAYDNPQLPVDTCAQYFAATDRCISQSLQDVGFRQSIFMSPPDVGTAAWNGTNFIGFIDQTGFRGPRLWSPFKTSKYFSRYGDLPFNFDSRATQISGNFDNVLSRALLAPGAPGFPQVPGQPTQIRAQRNLSASVQVIRQAVTGGIAASCDPQRDSADTCQRYADFIAEVLDPAVNERFFTGPFDEQIPPFRLNALAVYRSYLSLSNNIVVPGGNLRLIERLLALARARIFLKTEALSIRRLDSGKLELVSRTTDTSTVITKEFDKVIVAAPFRLAKLEFSPSLNDSLLNTLRETPAEYLDTFVTHFTSSSSLNSSIFDPDVPLEAGNPQRILSSAPMSNDAPFVSLRLVKFLTPPSQGRQPGQQESLYRLVTRYEPQIEVIKTYLEAPGNITWMDMQDLPVSTPIGYGTTSLVEDLEIMPGVIYAGAGEQVLSTADFGCRMGFNAAEIVLEGLLGGEDGRSEEGGSE